MSASGQWIIETRLRSPQPGGSTSVYEPGQQLEENTIESTGGTVAQIRVELEDHTADVGDDPVVRLLLCPAFGNFTANATTDIITTSAGHAQAVGNLITLSTTGTLPGGLSASVYVQAVISATELKVSATPGGAAINITTTGSGTHAWRGYGQITSTTEYGSGTSNVITTDGLNGEDNDFDLIRGIHVKLSRNDQENAAASARVIVECGDATAKMGYVRIPLSFDIDDAIDTAAAVVIPAGVAFDPEFPLKITIVDAANAQLLIALQGT